MMHPQTVFASQQKDGLRLTPEAVGESLPPSSPLSTLAGRCAYLEPSRADAA
jgi:hypothetical protein